MSWVRKFFESIDQALDQGQECQIAVHDDRQKLLGLIFASHLAGKKKVQPEVISFTMVESDRWKTVPVGTILN